MSLATIACREQRIQGRMGTCSMVEIQSRIKLSVSNPYTGQKIKNLGCMQRFVVNCITGVPTSVMIRGENSVQDGVKTGIVVVKG